MNRETKIQIISEDILVKNPTQFSEEFQEIRKDVSQWNDETLDREVFKLFELTTDL